MTLFRLCFTIAIVLFAPFAAPDAFAQANRTHYGLGGSVWTSNVAKGEELAERLECGVAWVNQHMNLPATAPFGGVKWSGIGRENGRWGIEEFCELQVVNASRA